MEGLRVLANPEELALFYYKNGADEILFTDVVASPWKERFVKCNI